MAETAPPADHDDHRAETDRIKALTGTFTAPAGACETWRTLNDRLAAFAADLQEHVRLENEVLFLRFESATPATGGEGHA